MGVYWDWMGGIEIEWVQSPGGVPVEMQLSHKLVSEGASVVAVPVRSV